MPCQILELRGTPSAFLCRRESVAVMGIRCTACGRSEPRYEICQRHLDMSLARHRNHKTGRCPHCKTVGSIELSEPVGI